MFELRPSLHIGGSGVAPLAAERIEVVNRATEHVIGRRF
jgi:hypothetical protein